jgi:hypothetical protein
MLTTCNETQDWGLRSSDTWCCVTGQVAPTISKDCSAFITPLNEGNGTTIPQTVGNRSPKYTPLHLRRPQSCEDVKSCRDMRCSEQSAVMWHLRYSRSLPVSVSVYQMLRYILNYHSLWMFWCWFISRICLSYAFNTRDTNTKFTYFLSVLLECM